MNPAEKDLFWSRLLDWLEEGKVVPIVGQDLLEVTEAGTSLPIVTVIARRALTRLGLSPEAWRGVRTMTDAAVCWLERGGQDNLGDLYRAVHRVAHEESLPIPDVLRTLAGIDPFKLFITTAADPLLARALTEVRGSSPRIRSYAYATRHAPDDLPARLDEIAGPVIYHLLGRTAVTDTYALTEEDVLEFVHSLQSTPDAPEMLRHELRDRSLLIIGSGYSDWLTRFFLRGTRGAPFSERNAADGFLADTSAGRDESFVRFIRHFGGRLQVFPGEARTFVYELADRWAQRAAEIRAPDAAGGTPVPAIEPEQIFVSYASEDLEHAELLVNRLREARLPVWFDKNLLRSGAEFEAEIRRGIGRCTLVIILLSRRLQTYEPRFFFREWDLAIDVAKSYRRQFIIPCRIDDVPRDAEQIPDAIRELHADDVIDDPSRAAFVEHIRDLFRKYQSGQDGP